MVFLRIFVLFLFVALSLAVPHSYIDRDEQRFIDHLLLNSKRAEKASAPSHHLREEEEDELEREGVPVVNQEVMKRARQTQNSKEFQLIKKAALAVVKRLSMPSPPKEDALIDKAVLFVLRRTLPGEYAKIRGGIKEQVDKMIFSNRSKQDSVKPNQKIPGLREEKILVALEDILSELAVQLNLTTLQIKFLVNSTVNVLAKYFGLNPWQNHELHERITSHVRAKLNYEDLDNKDARLRRLEENIEQDILHLKLTNNQAKRLEALMIEEEAVREGLSKSERLRMLKRVFADIKDDFKTELQEQESAPPKLSSVNIISIKNLIKQKALEMQLTKKELKVLALAILTAIEDLTMHTSPTPQGTQPTKATSMFKKTSPFTIKETEEPISRAPTPTKADELEEELEGTRHPSTSHSQEYKTTPSEHHTSSPHKEHVKTPTTASTLVTGTAKVEHSTRMSTEMNGKSADDLVSKLAQDEAELEEKDFHPIAKTEAKDDLELEQEAKTQLVKKTKTITEYKPTKPISMPVKMKPTKKVTESTAVTEDKKLENHVTKPIISHTIEATKPKTAKQSTLKATKKHTFEVTRPRTGSTLKHTHKPIATEIGKPKPTEKFMLTTDRANEEEDLLEGRVTKPTNGHDVTLLKTEHLIKTTLISTKANREKVTDEAKHSVSPTEKINKEIEEDLLEGRVTKPTKGQAVDITQLKTKANREKPTSEANPSVSPTKERNKEIEEDLLEGRNTMPKHGGTVHVSQPKTEEHVTKPTPNPDQQTEIRHTTFKHITTPTQAPGVDEESNRISKKGVLSRRHRVGIMDDDKELEDLGVKRNDKKEDDTSLENDLTLLGRPHKNDRKKDEASLEDDLSLLGRPHKDKSLENDLNEILAQKEAIHDESLEDELKDLSLG